MKYLILLLLTTNTYALTINKHNIDVVQSIITAADTVKVPRELLLALCWNESSFRTNLPIVLDGKTPSYGICQVKLNTARFLDKRYKNKLIATPKVLLNYKRNALYAAQYLKFQLNRYNGDWKAAVDAYNKGHVVSTKSVYVKRVSKHKHNAARYLSSIQ